jgi:sugar phosphate isomerase/epimerase
MMELKLDRRSFLKSAGALSAAGMLTTTSRSSVAQAASTKPQKFLAGMAPGSLGITIDGFWHTMEASSKVGFHNIEVDNSQLKLAQAYINKTGEFKDRMDKLQLRLVGLNESYSLLDTTKYDEIAQENRLIGKFMQAVGGIYTGPYGPLTNDEDLIRKIAVLCNQEGKRLMETNGIKFAYHTHSSLGFRRLMDVTDYRYVNLTTDLGWLARGYSTRGESSPPTDALEVVRAYESRLCTVHMKDWDPNPEYDYNGQHYKGAVTVPGKGIVNFPAVVDFLKDAGWTGQWLGEHVGIGTYEFERSPDAVSIYPAYKDYMVNVLHLNLALKV